jgi:hypothetical protein
LITSFFIWTTLNSWLFPLWTYPIWETPTLK